MYFRIQTLDVINLLVQLRFLLFHVHLEEAIRPNVDHPPPRETESGRENDRQPMQPLDVINGSDSMGKSNG